VDTLEIGVFGGIAGLHQGLEAALHQLHNAAAQNLYNLNRLRRSFFSVKYNLSQDYDANIKKFLIYRLFVRRKELKQLGVLLSQMENDFYFSPERKNHGQ